MRYADISFADKTYPISRGSVFTGAVPIDKYATYGVGSYIAWFEVLKLIPGSSGAYDVVCEGLIFLRVKGNPLGTAAGEAAAAAAVVGSLGLVASGASAARGPRVPEGWDVNWTVDKTQKPEPGDVYSDWPDAEGNIEKLEATSAEAEKLEYASRDEKALALVELLGKRYCAVLMLSVVFMAVAPPVGSSGPPRPRAHWRPRISIIGILSGLIGAVGVFVLLQQYAIVYPTRNAGIVALVIGLVAGLTFPSLGRLRAVRKTNRRIDSLYRR